MRFFKKGIAPGIFKWIFATIAGALILVFFIKFTFLQEGTSLSIDDRRVVYGLDDQLDALSGTEVASKRIDFKYDVSLKFDCDGIISNKFRKQTNKIIFSPLSLDGKYAQVWSRRWKFPFEISTFYYLSNKDSKSIIIYDRNTFSFVRDLEIPRSFNVQLMDISDFDPSKLLIGARSLDQLNLLFFTNVRDVNEIFSQFKGVNLNVVEINLQTHEVEINNGVNTESTFYLGEGMLYGLVFAPENYPCLKDKAIEQLKNIVEIYEEKAGLLVSKTSTRPDCQNLLEGSRKFLNTFKTLDDVNAFYQYSLSLESQNRDLEKNDCPKIY